MKQIDTSTVKMGSDAEVFLIDKTGRPFPACGLIGGTKEKPLPLSDDGCAVQEDNVMLEFNTPVSSSGAEWTKNLQRAMKLAFERIPPSFSPDISAVQRFHPAFLESRQASTFGCEPDFNAWTMEQNPRPTPEDATMRSAAAHVHISWKDPEDMLQRCRVIQMADIFVTLPSVWESPDRERRTLYGKAGAFRPKEYGVEHRVMDNYWLVEPHLSEIWYRYMQALEAANTPFEITQKLSDKVQDIINNYKADEAHKLHDGMMRAILPAYHGSVNVDKKKSSARVDLWKAMVAGTLVNDLVAVPEAPVANLQWDFAQNNIDAAQ